MEFVNCDLCGSTSASFVTKQTDVFHGTTKEYFSIVRCDQCGLHFTNPRPDKVEIDQYYPESYSFFEKAAPYKVFARRVLDVLANSSCGSLFSWSPPLSRQLARRVKPSVKDPVLKAFGEGLRGGLLDIGCGSGDHANFWGHSGSLKAYRRFMPVAGVEVSTIARKHLALSGIETWPSIELVPGQMRWSIVRMNWSLEHVHQPSSYFDFMNKHLGQGGRAVICVPNYEGLLYRLAPDCVELPIHLYHFTPKQIHMYAAKYGFRVRELLTFSYPGMFFMGVDVGLLPAMFGSNLGICEAKRFNCILDRFDSAGFGNDIVAILERQA